MRARRILAVAERDLRIEFSGRQGAILPLVVGLVLLPLAAAPHPAQLIPKVDKVYVRGPLPPEVAALPEVVAGDGPNATTLLPPSAGEPAWRVEGAVIPAALSAALNSMDRKIQVVTVTRPKLALPNRSFLLSLVAASTLTGALAQSIPGERASRTLETLRTASVSAGEIVVGKWLAWTGFAGGAAIVAGAIAVALGRQSLGPWVLALPWVAAGTAAGGLYLVRRANDVVGGATIALRTQPAALAFVALAAWTLGRVHPLLGASVPLGGALMAAGSLWEGWAPVLVSIASTAAACAALLAATARDLAEVERNELNRDRSAAVLMTGVAAVSWWVAVLGSMVWAIGGAVERTELIPLSAGPIGGMLALVCMGFALAARHPRPLESVGLVRAPAAAWAAAIAVGLGLPLLAPTTRLWSDPASATWVDARLRLIASVTPVHAGGAMVLATIAAQELLLRGWIRRAGGDAVALLASVLVLAPLDPVRGALEAAVMGALVLASGGAVLPAIAARLLAAGVGQGMPSTSPWVGVVAGLAGVAALLWTARRRP